MPVFHTLPDIRPLPAPIWIRLSRACFLFALGGGLYYFLEILFRGHSHFSMFLCGGLCFGGMYLINGICHDSFRVTRWIMDAMLVTVVEFWCGVAVNLVLGWNVWDYTDLPYNLLGQVCLPFTLIWFFLSIPADFLCDLLKRLFRVGVAQKY